MSLEYQIINIELKKNQLKFPCSPPKLSALDWCEFPTLLAFEGVMRVGIELKPNKNPANWIGSILSLLPGLSSHLM